MGIIRAIGLGHRFEKKNDKGEVISSRDALKDVNIDIEKGSFVAVIGRNGSGKSTFARHLNALLEPGSGSVLIDGRDTKDPRQLLDIRKSTGMVFQNPDNQIIADIVEEDAAFGPENLGLPSEMIWQRVSDALEAVGISHCSKLSPNRLSGGQKQRVAIAGILAMKPSCMILDEPTAMLDPSGRKSILDAVCELNRAEGITVIYITHYMEEAERADRVIVMDRGRVALDGKPEDIFSQAEALGGFGIELPPLMKLSEMLKRRGMNIPGGIISREEMVRAIAGQFGRVNSPHARKSRREDLSVQNQIDRLNEACVCAEQDKVSAAPYIDSLNTEGDFHSMIRLENVSYEYSSGLSYQKEALKNITVNIAQGKITGIIGSTGAGKSTLLQLMNALLKPTSGKVYFNDKDINSGSVNLRKLRSKVGLVFQYPENQLFGDDLISDVMFGPLNMGFDKDKAEKRAARALRMMGIAEDDFRRSPFELSGGQKRRAAIAGVLAMQPEVILLDEPMSGLDLAGRQELLDAIMRLAKKKKITVVWSSHSMEDMAEYAEDIIVMNEGQIVSRGSAKTVLSDITSLEKAGLAAPEAVYIIDGLRKRGIDIGTDTVTIEEAAENIIKICHNDNLNECD